MNPTTIVIILDEHGNVQVKGDLGNKVVALGLIDIARHVLLTSQPKPEPLVRPFSLAPGISRS